MNAEIFINGKKAVPKSFEIRSSAETPADSFTGIFLRGNFSPGDEIKVLSDEKDVLFLGKAEDAAETVSPEGVFTEIFARGIPAALIDNEALPKTYNCPSFGDIFKSHAMPFGIKGFGGENRRWQGTFSILKGDSHWDVIKRFCLGLWGTVPFISSELILYPSMPKASGKVLSLNNSLPGKTRFLKADISRSAYGAVGVVMCKTEKDGGYRHAVINSYIENPEKYLTRAVDLTNTPPWERQNKIDRIFRKSLEKSFLIEAVLPSPPAVFTGMEAEFYSPAGYTEKDLTVFSRAFRLTSKGYFCTVTLVRKGGD